MTNEHRDDAIDRLLTALQPLSRATSSSACLDPETLAAWIDNRLPGAARANAEAHAASCSRCQALLAAMARTTAAAPTEQPRSGLFGVAPWIAALGTAAIALVIWAGTLPHSGDSQRATEPRAVQQNEAARVDAPQEKSDVPASPVAQLESERRPLAGARAQNAPADAVAGNVSRDAESRQRAAPQARLKDDAGARRESKASTPDRSAPATKVVEGISTTAPSTVPGTPVPGAAAAPPPPAAAAAAPLPEPRPIPVTERPQEAQRMADLRRIPPPAMKEEALMAGQAGLSVAAIPTPDPKIAWRIVNGIIQLSTDGGATWTTKPTGVDAVLRAGSAPSTSVCWLVGPRGIVLVTADSGRTWQRLPFPEQIDLAGVIAASADAAAITAANGRKFSTTDRGRTWR